MNHLEKKIHLLHDQRKKLDDRLNTLLQERNKTILKILEKLPTASLDNATLIGGIMDVCAVWQKMPLTLDEELYYDFNLYKKGIVLELFMMMVDTGSNLNAERIPL